MVTDTPAPSVDFIDAGSSGPFVILVHSSVAGARQWRRLMDDLQDRFRVRAVNLFGYGKTSPWQGDRSQTLEDQAGLVAAALPADANEVYLAGHSFGGSVAMKAAALLGGRVTKLVLLGTNPFYLLKQAGHTEAFAEAKALRDCIKEFGAVGQWETAAERFADYWNGPGTWRDTPAERRAVFAKAIRPNFFEWDAVMDETTSAQQWAELLPAATQIVYDPGTVLPIRTIVDILRGTDSRWTYREVPGGGHMAPLTRPDLINPVVAAFLSA
jgi:pimeloyl-ACP methyl ester carboxylesterase